MKTKPRGWQADALPVTLQSLRSGAPTLVSACTGAGKSWFLAFVLADVLTTLRPGWAVVVTVPTEALVEQLHGTLAGFLGPERVGRWYGRRKRMATVTVCCLPSLSGLVAELRMQGQRCALWVGDEVHRAEAYESDLELLAPVCRLGLTATPYRSSTGLSLWPTLTYRYGMADAISDGVLVPPVVRLWRGDDMERVTEATIAMIRDHAHGPGVVSASNIDDAEDTAGVLSEAGIEALAIHSRMSHRERADRLEALRVGDVDALVHVRVLSEGVDLPWLRWLALRSAHSRTRVGLVQEVGRVLRIDPDDPTKTEGIVLDPLGLTMSVGIDHAEDLIAAADAEPEDRQERERQEELDALANEEALAQRFDDLACWLAANRHRLMGESKVLRTGAPTEAQIAMLDKVKGGTRWLASGDRERVQELLSGRMTARVAGDLIDLLKGAKRRARDHYRETGSWHGVPRHPIEMWS